jgi:DNA-binding GntR family transcriptional regulator
MSKNVFYKQYARAVPKDARAVPKDAATSPKAGATLSLPGAQHAVVRLASGEQAAGYIRRLIFDGELRQGMRLPQDQVAKALGVSRIPIREAIVALESEGWVTTRLHRGAFINAFDEETIRDHYELYGLVYGLAARRAVLRGDPEMIARLSELARQVVATDVPSEVQRIALAFHSTVVAGAHSPRIPVVLRAMSALVPGPFFELVPEAIASEQSGLPAVARAAKRGDGDRAAKEYSKMLGQQAEMVVDLFRRRNLIARSA